MSWIEDHHRQQFEADGYMVIRGVIPTAIANAAARDIAAFVGADLADSSTWYGGDARLDGVVPMHHAQSQWDIRQCPDLYEVFREFFRNPRLMVDINRCIFRPPAHPRHPGISHGSIHWDTDPRVPDKGTLQAGILLSDVVSRDCGGFQCLPEIYRNLPEWLALHARAKGFDFFNPGLNDCRSTQVIGNAGDVILWNTMLPHGSAGNFSDRPRIATFVTMEPPADDPQLRATMRSLWQSKRAPKYWRGLPGQLDPEPGEAAVLSDLGLKLIGVLPW